MRVSSSSDAYLHQSVFFAGVFLSSLIIWSSTWSDGDAQITLSMSGFMVFVLFGVAYARFDPRHPYVWFNVVFALYSLSAPALYILARYKYFYSYSDAIVLQYMALVAFSFAALLRPQTYENISFKSFSTLVQGRTIFLALAFTLSLFYLYGYLAFGGDIIHGVAVSDNFLLKLDIAFTFLLVGMAVHVVYHMVVHKRPCAYLVIALAGYFVLSLLIGGERDSIVRLMIVYLYLFITFYRHIKPLYLIGFAAGLAAFSTLAGMLKYVFVTKELIMEVGGLTEEDSILSFESLPMLVFGSEFRTAGSNLAELMDSVPSAIPYWEGKSTLTELASSLSIGFLSERGSLPSTASWFTEEFYGYLYERGGGAGFTLVGQGYLDFGVAGVIGLFLILGITVRKLYEFSSKSATGYVLYVVAIPIFMLSIRQTISPIISQGLKHVLLSLLALYLIGVIVKVLHHGHPDRQRVRSSGVMRYPSPSQVAPDSP